MCKPIDQCNCVPFYQCRHQNVKNLVRKSCKATEVCCEMGQPTEEDCGWSSNGEDGALVAAYGEFPWLVAILNVSSGGNWTREEYVGGGAIIHPRVVLTAAHRVHGISPKELKCRAGIWSRTHAAPAHDRAVSRIRTHPLYDQKYMAYDMALIRLEEPFNISLPTVSPLCVGKGPPRDNECFAMGWGVRKYQDKDYADRLKKVKASMVPRGICWRALQAVDDERQRKRGRKVREQLELHDTLLCAGGLKGQDTCTGDGGSPLVCKIQGNDTRKRYAAYGVVSWGIGCGDNGAPGVYVDVSKLHDWIISTLQSLLR